MILVIYIWISVWIIRTIQATEKYSAAMYFSNKCSKKHSWPYLTARKSCVTFLSDYLRAQKTEFTLLSAFWVGFLCWFFLSTQETTQGTSETLCPRDLYRNFSAHYFVHFFLKKMSAFPISKLFSDLCWRVCIQRYWGHLQKNIFSVQFNLCSPVKNSGPPWFLI